MAKRLHAMEQRRYRNGFAITLREDLIALPETWKKPSLVKEWVESIYQQCRTASVPFFFKQWGGTRKDLTGRELHERTYDEMPTAYTREALNMPNIAAVG